MIKTVNKLSAYLVKKVCGLAPYFLVFVCALAAGGQTEEQSSSTPVINTFPSPYMNAKNIPLVEIGNGAKVGRDTAAYWNLPPKSQQRASYDDDIIVEVADGIWTIGTHSIVNIHAVEGPEGLIIYDTGDNLEDGAHFYSLLRSVTKAPIRAIVYSHEHYVNGAKVFVEEEAKRENKNIKIIGHPNTNDSIARTGGVSAAHPEVSSVLMARSKDNVELDGH